MRTKCVACGFENPASETGGICEECGSPLSMRFMALMNARLEPGPTGPRPRPWGWRKLYFYIRAALARD